MAGLLKELTGRTQQDSGPGKMMPAPAEDLAGPKKEIREGKTLLTAPALQTGDPPSGVRNRTEERPRFLAAAPEFVNFFFIGGLGGYATKLARFGIRTFGSDVASMTASAAMMKR